MDEPAAVGASNIEAGLGKSVHVSLECRPLRGVNWSCDAIGLDGKAQGWSCKRHKKLPKSH
jgi:hypothetical protein